MIKRVLAFLLFYVFITDANAQNFDFAPTEFVTNVDKAKVSTFLTNGNYPNPYTGVFPFPQNTNYSNEWDYLTGGIPVPVCTKWDFLFKSVQNFVRVKIDKSYSGVLNPYKLRLYLEVKTYGTTTATSGSNIPATVGPPLLLQTQTPVLEVSYDPNAGLSYNDMSVFKTSKGLMMEVSLLRMEDAVTYQQVPLNDFPDNLMIEAAVSVKKMDLIGNTSVPTVTRSAGNGYLDLDWHFNCNSSVMPRPEGVDYELEWQYLDDYDVNVSAATATISHRFSKTSNSITYNFKDNATRVRVAAPHYSIPLIYQQGAIVYRVRALYPDPNTYTDVIYGPWSLPDNGSVALNSATLGEKAYVVTASHRGDKLNWSYGIDFAEEGKYKQAIHYFDGGLKNRQTQTKISSDNNYILAVDRAFDYEGRNALTSLPTPVYSPAKASLNYDPKILYNNVTAVSASDFDHRTTTTNCMVPAAPFTTGLQSTSTNSKSKAEYYYSANNQEKQGMQQYVPRSKGYPFIQTIYSSESGDKPLAQGGAGPDLQIATGKHFTSYDYSSPTQFELDRLIGTEAGHYAFYPKITQTDPNGQTSFTILNKYGKPVISGLAGAAPASLQQLPGLPAANLFKTDLLHNLDQSRQDAVVRAEGSFMMDVAGGTTAPTLKYSASFVPFFACYLSSNPYSYIQVPARLKINVTDACGSSVMDNHTPYQATLISTTQYNGTSSTFQVPLTGNLLDRPSFSKGKYSFTKELSFSRADMVNAAKDFIGVSSSALVTNHCGYLNEMQFIGNEILKITESCEAAPGEVQTDLCEALKKKMIEELYPGAKYGKYNKNGWGMFCAAPGNSIFATVIDPTQNQKPLGEPCTVIYDRDLYTGATTGAMYYMCDRGFAHYYEYEFNVPPCDAPNFSWKQSPGCHKDQSGTVTPVPSNAQQLCTVSSSPGSGGYLAPPPPACDPPTSPYGPKLFPDNPNTTYQYTCTQGKIHYWRYFYCGGLKDPHQPTNYPCYRWQLLDPAGIHYNFTPPSCSCTLPVNIQSCNITATYNSGSLADVEFQCSAGLYHAFQTTFSELGPGGTPGASGVYCSAFHFLGTGPHQLFYHINGTNTGLNITTPHTDPDCSSKKIYRYQTDCIDYGTVVSGGVTYSSADIKRMSPDELMEVFNDEIAERLLPLHPEYCKLQACGDQGFVDTLLNTATFDEAKTIFPTTYSASGSLLSSHFPIDLSVDYTWSDMKFSVIGRDPLYRNLGTALEKQNRIRELVYLPRMYPATHTPELLFEKTIDRIAFAMAVANAGNANEFGHFIDNSFSWDFQDVKNATWLGQNSYQNSILRYYPAPVKKDIENKYWNHLKYLYLATHNYIRTKLMNQGGSCEPCSASRLTLIGDPFTLPGLNSSSELELPQSAFDNAASLGIDMGAIYGFNHSGNFNGIIQNPTNGTLPSAGFTAANTANAALTAEAFLLPLQPRLTTTVFNNMKTAVRNKLTADKADEITPDYIKTFLSTNNASCNAYLLDYNAINPKTEDDKPYFCPEPAVFTAVVSFVNTLLGSNPATSGNPFPLTLNSADVYQKNFTGLWNPGQNQVALIKSSAQATDGVQTVWTFHLIQNNAINGQPNNVYIYLTVLNPKQPAVTSLPSAFSSASCINDKTLQNSGYMAKNTAVLKDVNGMEWLVFSPFGTVMTENDDPEFARAINCHDIRQGLAEFESIRAQYGNATYYNDPYYHAALANFLNYKFKKNHTSQQYEELMQGCAVTDVQELRTSPLRYLYSCATGSAAASFISALQAYEDASPETGLGPDVVRLTYTEGANTILVLDYSRVPLRFMKTAQDKVGQVISSVTGISSIAVTPAANYAATVFLPSAITAAFPAGLTTASTTAVTVTEDGQALAFKKYLLNFTSSTTTALARSNVLQALAAYLDGPTISRYTAFYGKQVLRSPDYSSTAKQAYLGYLGTAAFTGAGHAMAATLLKTTHTGLRTALLTSPNFTGLTYKDPVCRGSLRDLYLYSNTSKSAFSTLTTLLNAYPTLVASGTATNSALPTSRQLRKASGGYWFYYVDHASHRNNSYNVYLLPPKGTDIGGYSINTGSIVPAQCNENGDVYSFDITLTKTGKPNLTCKGYTDFAIGEGAVKLQNVVLYDGPDKVCENIADCEYQKLLMAIEEGKNQYSHYFNEEVEKLAGRMMTHFTDPMNTLETLELEKEDRQYQYTLYSYDRAGNLMRTVPPAGITPLSNAVTATIEPYRTATGPLEYQRYMNITQFKKASEYKYNSLNQLIEQMTPDGGTTAFFYDSKGRLTFSQNAEQQARGTYYSYILYDALDRVTETGEIKLTAAVNSLPAIITALKNNSADYNTIFTTIRSNLYKTDVVLTEYDAPTLKAADLSDANYSLSGQANLRKRVSCVKYFPRVGQTNLPGWKDNPEYAIYYSYDVLGNVATLTHEIKELTAIRQKFKRIDYDYDLWSGKVNLVSYNRGFADQFYQRYTYDADNRIATAETSNDGLIWNKDARYDYYRHGPLASVVLGDDQVQSMQYAYTLQGWLKAINGDVLHPNKEMGRNGVAVPSGSIDPVARDAAAHSLDYFDGDYEPVGSAPVEALLATATAQNKKTALAAAQLFNGNIARQYTSIAGIGVQVSGDYKGMERTYTYDQLNRITEAANKTVNNSLASGGTKITGLETTPANHFKTTYQYDADGNIKGINRWDGQTTPLQIDQLQYTYTANQNRLTEVNELKAHTQTAYTDIKPHSLAGQGGQPAQVGTTYQYDAAGNLIKDQRDKLEIAWSAYGKVKNIQVAVPGNLHTLSFGYDGLGHRVVKRDAKVLGNGEEERNTEYYIRDASGNLLTLYKSKSYASRYPMIASYNGDVVSRLGLAPFTGFIKDLAAAEAAMRTDLLTLAISQAPTWVTAQTSAKTGLFYLQQNEGIRTELLLGNDEYYEAFRSYAIGGGQTGADYIAASFAVAKPEDRRNALYSAFEEKPITTAHLKYFASYMPESYCLGLWDAFGKQYIPDNIEASAQTLAAYVHADNRMEELAEGMSMVLTLVQEEGDEGGVNPDIYHYYKAALEDDNIYKAPKLRNGFRTPFEQNLTALILSAPQPEPRNNFVLQWSPGYSWVEANVSSITKLSTIYNADASATLTSLYQADATVIDKAVSDIPGLTVDDYARKLTAKGLGPLTPLSPTYVYRQDLSLSEHHLYGSSHLGIQYYDAAALKSEVNYATNTYSYLLNGLHDWYSHLCGDLVRGYGNIAPWSNWSLKDTLGQRIIGMRHYSLTDHLGNVLATVLDRKTGHVNPANTAVYDYWMPDIATAQDYYPFGMLMPGRILQGDKYRFGFNGIEKVNEVAGTGNHYTAFFGEYDPRIASGGRWNPDPKPIASESPYAMFRNNPIWYSDPLLDYSKVGAWWRNAVNGGNGISKSEKTGEWGYEKGIPGGVSYRDGRSRKPFSAEKAIGSLYSPAIKLGEKIQEIGDKQWRVPNNEWNGGKSWEGDKMWREKGWPTAKATVGVLGTIVSGGALSIEFAGAAVMQTLTARELYSKSILWAISGYSAGINVYQAAGGSENAVNNGVDYFNQVNDLIDAGNAGPMGVFNTTVNMIDWYQKYGGSVSGD